jgi:hypothetical protein
MQIGANFGLHKLPLWLHAGHAPSDQRTTGDGHRDEWRAREERQASLLRDHAEWSHSHDLAMPRPKEMAEAREPGREIDERIEKLVSAIGEFLRREGN